MPVSFEPKHSRMQRMKNGAKGCKDEQMESDEEETERKRR
jgi:hypothetical protein